MFGAGKLLSRQVAQPLRAMEEKMQAVARGEIRAIDLGSSDREIRSLTAAFNRMIEELDARQREMVRSEKLASLGTMLSGVAHELNNPLSNISTSTQILAEELGQAEPDYQRELVEQIDSETDRARQIVRALLDFAPDRALRRESVPLQPLLQYTLRLFAGQVPDNVRVTLEVPADITVDADRPRLQQVFLNLFRNAVEAMPAGGELTVRASNAAPEAAQSGRRPPRGAIMTGRPLVEIEVRDSGIREVHNPEAAEGTTVRGPRSHLCGGAQAHEPLPLVLAQQRRRSIPPRRRAHPNRRTRLQHSSCCGVVDLHETAANTVVLLLHDLARLEHLRERQPHVLGLVDDVATELARREGRPRPDPAPTDTEPLPGGEAADLAPMRQTVMDLGLGAETADHLLRHYGTEAAAICNLGRLERGLLARLHPDHPAIEAEVVHHARRELVLRSIESTARERGGGALAFPLDGIIHKLLSRL